jgi:chromosome segregation ATPase
MNSTNGNWHTTTAGSNIGVNMNWSYPAQETNMFKRIFNSKQVQSVLAENYGLMRENQLLRNTEAAMRRAYYSLESAYNRLGKETFTLKAKTKAISARAQQQLLISCEKERQLNASLEIRSKQTEGWKQRVEGLQKERNEMQLELGAKNKETDRLQTKIKQLENDLHTTSGRLKSVILENNTLQGLISSLQEQRGDLDAERLALVSERVNGEQELAVMKEENLYLTNQLAALKVEHESLHNDLPTVQRECDALTQKLEVKESAINDISGSRDAIGIAFDLST